MDSGKILVADHQGVFVIKMVGDVRLTLCLSFDAFISEMFSSEGMYSVVFDLCDADGIDSTTLGLMAKISIMSTDKNLGLPLAVVPSAGLRRLLESMGFDEIFDVVETASIDLNGLRKLQSGDTDEVLVREKVLEAHKTLMGLNEHNKREFTDLIKTLER